MDHGMMAWRRFHREPAAHSQKTAASSRRPLSFFFQARHSERAQWSFFFSFSSTGGSNLH